MLTKHHRILEIESNGILILGLIDQVKMPVIENSKCSFGLIFV